MLASRYFHYGLLDGQEGGFPVVSLTLTCQKYLGGLLIAGSFFSLQYIFNTNMGNQNFAPTNHQDHSLIEQLCSLTQEDFPRGYRLSANPFGNIEETDISSSTHDFPISTLTDEAEETQPLRMIPERQPRGMSIGGDEGGDFGDLQKNQNLQKPIRKNKKIVKEQKTRAAPRQRPEIEKRGKDEEPKSAETVGEECIRDQNNCKSYHKLVKNFLMERGLAEMVEKYDTKYHTRYYFIVCLLMVKHHLKEEDFPNTYQQIVEGQLATQQRKIDRKTSELASIHDKLKNHNNANLRVRQLNLESQIQHIKVVKFQIETYSVRSCRAFFSGDMEGALRILYLKNDPVMRKKYYFEEALEILKEIQKEMRKNGSHS